MTSVAVVVRRSIAGNGTPGEVSTLPFLMWSVANPKCKRQWVMALEEPTSSVAAGPVAKRSLAAYWIPVTVVAHHGRPVSHGLQLSFATWAS